MPIPFLAVAVSGISKLAGNIFGAKGKARRVARKASGKRGLFGKVFGGIGKLFKRKRNKSQRIQDSANRVFTSRTKKDAKLAAKTKEAWEKQLTTAGGDVASYNERINPTAGTKKLPSFFGNIFRGATGVRQPQQMQLPPDVRESLIRSQAEPIDDSGKPFKSIMDEKTMLYIGGALALLLVVTMMKK